MDNLFEKYIEEKAVHRILPQSQNTLADINSLTAYNGYGGVEEPDLVSITNENTITAVNPVLTNFSDTRSGVATYIVQSGDNLSFIAADFGVSTNSIIWANKLKDVDSIQPGQEIKIPPVSGVIHIVKKGDTIESIAEKYKGNVEEIIEFNVLPSDGAVEIGKEIVIPEGQIVVPRIYAKSSRQRFTHLPNLTGYFLLPTNGFNWGRIHGRNAVDIANACGTPIYAAATGNVATALSSGWNGGGGKVIKILHSNGTETLYAHLSRVLVSRGENVSQGRLIGLMGSTGRSTGCHLHFEVHGARNPLAKY